MSTEYSLGRTDIPIPGHTPEAENVKEAGMQLTVFLQEPNLVFEELHQKITEQTRLSLAEIEIILANVEISLNGKRAPVSSAFSLITFACAEIDAASAVLLLRTAASFKAHRDKYEAKVGKVLRSLPLSYEEAYRQKHPELPKNPAKKAVEPVPVKAATPMRSAAASAPSAAETAATKQKKLEEMQAALNPADGVPILYNAATLTAMYALQAFPKDPDINFWAGKCFALNVLHGKFEAQRKGDDPAAEKKKRKDGAELSLNFFLQHAPATDSRRAEAESLLKKIQG